MRKSIKRNLAYDDQKDLYYVTMHYGMRPDGSRDRCVRTFRCLDDAESTLTEFLRLRALKRTRHGGEVILADWLEAARSFSPTGWRSGCGILSARTAKRPPSTATRTSFDSTLCPRLAR